MTTYGTPFSGFSVKDVAEARAFYGDVLGLRVSDVAGGMIRIDLGDDHGVLVYPKGDAHQPATFTVLNLPTDDVSSTVRELTGRGVDFVRYEGMPQDQDGVMKGNGPDIAWFADPSGNVMSIVAQ